MKQLFSTLFFVALATFAQAANIILDNTAALNTPNIYTSAQAAHDAAQAGDVIYVKGSPTSYGTLIITKKISLIGPGYFLAQNPKTQVQVASALFDHIKLDNGSNNTLIRGVSVIRGQTAIILTSTSNILIEACYVQSHYYVGGSGHTHGIHATNSSNVTISKSYVNVYNTYGNTSINYSTAIYGTNSIISLLNSIVANGAHNGGNAISTNGSTVRNCVFLKNGNGTSISNGNDCLIEDCIAVNLNGGVGGSNSLVRNSIATTNILPNNNNNQNNVAGTSLFVDYDGTLGYSTDGKWQLKAGSPAIGTGYSGGDIGAFGGTFPYVLSGTVGPHIYSLTHPQAGSAASGLIVTIKARVN